MSDGCDECAGYRDAGARFCGACGKRVGRSGFSLFLEDKMKVIATITMVYLLLELSLLLLSTPSILSIIGEFGVDLIIIVPHPRVVYMLTGAGAELYWIGAVAVITASILFATFRYVSARRAENGGSASEVKRTALFWIGILFSASLLVEILLFAISAQLGFGTDVGWTSDYTDTELLFMLANASVWEELISRVALIGIPIVLIQLARTGDPRSAAHLLGGFGMSCVAVVLIVFSGIMFGAAHYNGWGIAKAVITCLGGVIFGYVYVRFGVYASIIMHFLTNYLSGFIYADGFAVLGIFGSLLFLMIGFVSLAYLLTRIPGNTDVKAYLKSLPLFPESRD